MTVDAEPNGPTPPVRGNECLSTRYRARLRTTAAAAVSTAGALHLVAALEHLGHEVRFAVFFLSVGAAQLALAPRLWRGAAPRTALAVGAATLVLVLLHLYTRTVGLHLGPHADRPEDPDALGLAVVACEIVLVGALTAGLPERLRGRTVNALLGLGTGVWALWLSGVLG